MAHLLLIQEFGGNLGHINRLVAVARDLGPHRFTAIVPHPALALPRVREVLGPDVPVLQAPPFEVSDVPWPPRHPERTLADILHAVGYHKADAIGRAASAWRDLMGRLCPDLLVSDFAVTPRLANGARVPILAVGDCFNLPPPGVPCPPILPDAAEDPASLQRETEVLRAAGQVARRFGADPVDSVAALFAGDISFALGVRLLDPYASLRTDPERPTISLPRIPRGPAFASRTGPPIFCYLWADHPALNLILSALNRVAVPSTIHVRGIDPAALAAHCAPQVGVRTAEADFVAVLPQSRLFVHYGGGGSCFAGLLAGTIQMVLPTALEQQASAVRLSRAGVAVGLRLTPEADPDALARLMVSTLADAAKERAALRLADEMAAIPPIDTKGDIRSAAERLLASGRGSRVRPR